MKTVAILSQKGGAGKTTLAVHVAVAAQLAGNPTAILDMDQQGTAEIWSHWRETVTNETEPRVFAAKIPTLANWLATIQKHGGALALIDTPPEARDEAEAAAEVADLILIPCRPNSFDLHAIKKTADLAKRSGKRAYAIFNAGIPREKATIYEASAGIIAGFGLDLAPVKFSDRATFRQAVGSGQTAQEIEPDGKAASEVAALWNWLSGILAPI